jgi:hypothetical protein
VDFNFESLFGQKDGQQRTDKTGAENGYFIVGGNGFLHCWWLRNNGWIRNFDADFYVTKIGEDSVFAGNKMNEKDQHPPGQEFLRIKSRFSKYPTHLHSISAVSTIRE